MKTLDRYLIREILPPLFLSLLIFTFILQIPPVMEQLEALVSKGVSWGIAARMLLTLIPQALGLTIPMALLVGLLIGLGRLSGDREAVALQTDEQRHRDGQDRKSTCLNSSHPSISYAVFCLKKKKKNIRRLRSSIELLT